MKACRSCELIARRDSNNAPLWDNIFRTEYWDVVHHLDTELVGWLVLVTRRHIPSVAELSAAEASELGQLLRTVSLALKQVTGCLKTYVLQFAEHPRHPHVHFHITPRMKAQPDNRRGPQIMAYAGVNEDNRVDEATMNEIGAQVRQFLLSINDKN
ncbi:HIT family protein [Candidatus Leptofilum sp.]|uniref:HIT family protein n=1 Tax=Candidatus Leptofilum sp. TaxID=3241576 RepID=UPI003B5B3592